MTSSTHDWIMETLYDQDHPVLDLGKRGGMTDYIDFVTLGDVTAPIMKGVDKFNRPFVTLRVIDRATRNLSVHTLFQRYTDSPYTWCCGSCYENIVDTCIRLPDREYLTRLLKHEPCGMGLFHGEEGPRTTAEGLSTIEIY